MRFDGYDETMETLGAALEANPNPLMTFEDVDYLVRYASSEDRRDWDGGILAVVAQLKSGFGVAGQVRLGGESPGVVRQARCGGSQLGAARCSMVGQGRFGGVLRGVSRSGRAESGVAGQVRLGKVGQVPAW